MNRLLILLITTLSAMAVSAQEPADSLAPTIADHLTASGKALVVQPAKLNERLRPTAGTDAQQKPAEATAGRTAGGFRILLFSGNNPRTAKNEATNRSQTVASQFPEYATYVTYDAPYWRLKVGDFRTYDEASSALARLRAAMPSCAREMRVVRERINL